MEKGTSQFCRSAGRCGAMRHGVHAGMPLGCPLPASLGEITSFSKKPSFLGNHSKAMWASGSQGQGQGMQARARHEHAAKAKAKACCVHAAKAMAAPMGKQSRPRHAAKAMACLCGHAGMPLGARQQGPWGHAAKALASTLPDGAMAARRGRGMPRGWDAKAVACHWDP